MIKTGSHRRLNRETRKSWRLVRSDNGGNGVLGNKLGNCFENSEKLKYCFALESKVGLKQVYLIFKRCFNQRDFILQRNKGWAGHNAAFCWESFDWKPNFR